jgi:type I restriction enzyme S subunit
VADWLDVALGDLVEIKHGFAFQGEFFRDDPPGDVLLTPGNFAIGGGFKGDKLKYYAGPVPEEYVLSAGDLIVTMTDLSKEGDTLGYPAIIPTHSHRLLHNQRIGKVLPVGARVDVRFLYYLLCTREYRNEVLASATGTTVKHTSPSRIRAFGLSLPPLSTQQGIADVLRSLDNKIELNGRMNQTLESMARDIFRSWFVDFDPVIAKAEGRQPFGMSADVAALFPREFDESNPGSFPRGWTEAPLGKHVRAVYDGPHATPPPAESGPIFLGIRNMTGSKIDLAEVRHISEEQWARWTKRVTPEVGDIVFTYEATVGAFAVIPPGMRCCLGRRLALIRPSRERYYPHFLLHTFVSPPFQELLASRLNQGSTVQRIPLTDFPKYPILWPGDDLADRFERIAEPLWRSIHVQTEQSRTLAALRDTLLPKLMSGELRVRDTEKLVGIHV